MNCNLCDGHGIVDRQPCPACLARRKLQMDAAVRLFSIVYASAERAGNAGSYNAMTTATGLAEQLMRQLWP